MTATSLLLLLTAFSTAAGGSPPSEDSWPLACAFLPPTDPIANCARRTPSGEIKVRSAVVADQAPSATVSAVLVDDLLLYVIASGKTAPALWFDNGADYFVEGLARTTRSGKIGFVDEGLVEVIAAVWEFAFPFESGLAVVCNGCRSEPVGEHREVVGGDWGYIDSRGEVVVPLSHSRDELPSRDQLQER
jgi:hypothetical protein